jgi:cyclophilin family peptidyl-prolyl cis-trans isomerase
MSVKSILGGTVLAVLVIAWSGLFLASTATERLTSDSGLFLPVRSVAIATDTSLVDPADETTPVDHSPPAGDGGSLVECTISTPPVDAQGYQSGGSRTAPDGILQITVRHDLSPIASQVFLDLVNAHHFDGVFIFRVLKGFIAQWGVRTANDKVPGMTKPHKTKDQVHDETLSNVRGTLSFAGGNPATAQVFVNLGKNQRLDKENSRPFATVESSSMHLLDHLYTGYKDGQGQIKTLHQGEAAMRNTFPRMSRVKVCRTVLVFSSID